MGRTTDQIEWQIASHREALKSNFAELEDKVKAAGDWRQQFYNHPSALMMAAFGGGVVLAALTRGSRRGQTAPVSAGSSAGSEATSATHTGDNRNGPLYDAWDSIKGALIGVAATKVQSVMSDVVPGFTTELEKVQKEKNRAVT